MLSYRYIHKRHYLHTNDKKDGKQLTFIIWKNCHLSIINISLHNCLGFLKLWKKYCSQLKILNTECQWASIFVIIFFNWEEIYIIASKYSLQHSSPKSRQQFYWQARFNWSSAVSSHHLKANENQYRLQGSDVVFGEGKVKRDLWASVVGGWEKFANWWIGTVFGESCIFTRGKLSLLAHGWLSQAFLHSCVNFITKLLAVSFVLQLLLVHCWWHLIWTPPPKEN